MTKTLVRSWQSQRGKYWVKLFVEHGPQHESFYSYQSDNGGGYMGCIPFNAAYARAALEASFAPSKMQEITNGSRT
jgi:hypothetical protein